MPRPFQRDNFKFKRDENRTDIYNSSFNNYYKLENAKKRGLDRHMHKWVKFVSWSRWYPDLFYDLITPEKGGIRLDLDQRVLLRGLSRFIHNYGVFPRGYGKTLIEVMGLIHTAIFFPHIEISMTAQTKENAGKILEEKYTEIVRFYPLLKDEVTNAHFQRDNVKIQFTSGGRIDILANAQSSKGVRRRRLNVEEAFLMVSTTFDDVLEPIVNVPRRTAGEGLINPEELNGQINFFTTSGFVNTSEHDRNLQFVRDMAMLKGNFILGSDWQLSVHYGRGETKAQILAKKERLSPTTFAQNYESRWCGATDGALVNMNQLFELRTHPRSELKGDGKSHYIMGVDVARSTARNNNKSSIAVFKVKHDKHGRLLYVTLVNLITVSNMLNFSVQSAICKRVRQAYDAQAVAVDYNGLGSGLLDELLKDTIDPVSGDSLGCWDTMNTDHEPEDRQAEPYVYGITSQGIQHDIIVNFIDFVESGKLRLLEKRANVNYDISDTDYFENEILPYVNTDLFLEEVSNLKIKQNTTGRLSIERITTRIDKDRWAAVAYGLYYIKNNLDLVASGDAVSSVLDYLVISNAWQSK